MDIYVVDTNALIKDADLLDKIHYGEIVIHTTVLEELDGIARRNNAMGKIARRVGQKLYELHGRGNFLKGIKVDDKVIRFDDRKPNTEKYLRFGFDENKHDNLLLCVARELKEITGERVVFLTGDRFLSLKASMDVEVRNVRQPVPKKRKKGNKYYNNRQVRATR